MLYVLQYSYIHSRVKGTMESLLFDIKFDTIRYIIGEFYEYYRII